jgi:hypothetical protein
MISNTDHTNNREKTHESFYLYEYMGLLPVIGVVRIANHFIYTSTWVYFRLLVWEVNPCTRINKMISNTDHTNNRK